jgi:ubiquinone/menaquinone biosynthesis C-methylase UbiE
MRSAKPHPASERQAWAVEKMRIAPDDRVLEIGCGHGVAVSLVCEKLGRGNIHAIDRSRTMIDMARKRNAAFVKAGKASFQAAPLHEANLGGRHFDKVFAIHVASLGRPGANRDLAIVRRCLAPGGRFYLFFASVDPKTKPSPGSMPAALKENGFDVTRTEIERLATAYVGVVAAAVSG